MKRVLLAARFLLSGRDALFFNLSDKLTGADKTRDKLFVLRVISLLISVPVGIMLTAEEFFGMAAGVSVEAVDRRKKA